MAFFVVSRRVLFRELLASYCVGEGFVVEGFFETLAEIPATARNPNVILHITSGDYLAELGIDEFRDRIHGSHIIALKSGTAPGESDEVLQSKVEAIVSDHTSVKALTGFLTVVQEGFRITPPREEAGHAGAGPVQGSSAPTSRVSLAESEGLGLSGHHESTRTNSQTQDVISGSPQVAGLSARELAVVKKLREGASNKDIAKKLNIVESTVKVHLRACYRKIGVHNRTQAAIWAAANLPG